MQPHNFIFAKKSILTMMDAWAEVQKEVYVKHILRTLMAC